jgi:hypothetical protein
MKNILIFSIALFFLSCNDDGPRDIPLCIDQEIEVFEEFACPGGDLTIWNFDGDEVYCFNQGNCLADGSAYIYDEQCNLICTLGGFAGNTLCQGLDWNSNATYLELVYTY